MRAAVYFWAATLASVILLGAGWRLLREHDSGTGALDLLLATVVFLLLASTLFVSGRIAWTIGRAKRAAKRVAAS